MAPGTWADKVACRTASTTASKLTSWAPATLAWAATLLTAAASALAQTGTLVKPAKAMAAAKIDPLFIKTSPSNR
jgi:hypothetical protein